MDIQEYVKASTSHNSCLEKHYKEREWIIVIYYRIWYAGKIIKISNDKLYVDFLHRDKNIFFQPKTPDVQSVEKSQLLCEFDYSKLVRHKNKSQKIAKETFDFIDCAEKKCKIYKS